MGDFNKLFVKITSNKNLVRAVENATQRALQKREETISRIPDFEEAREQVSQIRKRSINTWQELLTKFVENATRKGFQVHVVESKEEANKTILDILQQHNVKLVVKGKSMATEELGIRDILGKNNIGVYETDLGEFIIQLAGESPAHLTGPAIHKDRYEIARLLHEKIGIPNTDSPEELTKYVREFLREKFLNADAGITGANFLIAESGSVLLVENEANIRLSTSLPKLHIAVAGFEKLINDFNDAAPILKVLAPSSTGQRQTSYVNIISSAEDVERHVVILTHGRKEIAEDPVLKEALKCIKCGACANACPIFQIAGGHLYEGVYTGPIGIIWNYQLYGRETMRDLPFLCTLCGACEEVCPAKIEIPELILELRRREQRIRSDWSLKLMIKIWTLIHTNSFWGNIANFAVKMGEKVFYKKGSLRVPLPILKKWEENKDIILK